MANTSIKDLAKKYNVKLWEIADELNLSDSNFSRKLRYEFSTKEKEQILALIVTIANSRKEM